MQVEQPQEALEEQPMEAEEGNEVRTVAWAVCGFIGAKDSGGARFESYVASVLISTCHTYESSRLSSTPPSLLDSR